MVVEKPYSLLILYASGGMNTIPACAHLTFQDVVAEVPTFVGMTSITGVV